jgi:hypothetical protein
MMVVCKHGSKFLTKGKIYEVTASSNNMYLINNKASHDWFHKMNFIPISEQRNKKIEEILKKDETKE